MSIGFCVATTMNGRGIRCTPTVGRQRALLHDLEQRRLGLGRGAVDLVAEHDVGEHRAALELELAVSLVVDRDTPVTSEGSRSGVNWMRCQVRSIEPASARASDVLPVPGTSSSSRCPSASRQMHGVANDLGLALDGDADVAAQPLDVVGDAADGLLRRGHGAPTVMAGSRRWSQLHRALRRSRRARRRAASSRRPAGVPQNVSVIRLTGGALPSAAARSPRRCRRWPRSRR